MTITSIIAALTTTLAAWTPVNSTQFWVTPEKSETIRFESADVGETKSTPFVLRTTDGDVLKEDVASLDGNSLEITITLPQGYFELELPETSQTFGVVSQPAFLQDDEKGTSEEDESRQIDPFFAIDAASTWLVRKDGDVREDLIRNARRMGIATYRERVSWARIEPKEGEINLEADNSSDSLRKIAKKNGMPVLELFHNAPDWTGKIGTYPVDLVKTAKSWGKIAKSWEPYWGAIEVWNEPDISFSGNLPADQYVPILKTIGYEFDRLGVKTPIVGGVIAAFQDDFMNSLADNGALNLCDIFSFHTYCRAFEMEGVSLRYLHWLEKNDSQKKPVWITECGRPWRKGTDRPNREADLLSGIDIVQKGVVAKALGVDAYFPFVYVFYEENDNNFGMCDRNNAPLRASAAYARSIYWLNRKECVGQWRLNAPEPERSYVFVNKQTNACVVVAYARDMRKGRTLQLPLRPLRVERATGESVAVDENNVVDFSDGFLFIELPKDADLSLKEPDAVDEARKTRADAKAKAPDSPRANASTVLRFDFDKETTTATADGYRINDPETETFTGTISVFNLAEKDVELPIQAKVLPGDAEREDETIDAISISQSRLSIKARGVAQLQFKIDATKISPFSGARVVFTAGDEGYLSFFVSQGVTAANFLKFAREICAFDLNDPSAWNRSASTNGTLDFIDGLDKRQGGKGWGFNVKFSDENDRWAYPVRALKFQEGTRKLSLRDVKGTIVERDLSEFKGVAFRVKGSVKSESASLRFFTYSDKGPYYYTSAPFAPADGQERFVFIPFRSLNAYGGVPDSFDPNRINAISIGCNSKSSEVDVQVGDFYFFK